MWKQSCESFAIKIVTLLAGILKLPKMGRSHTNQNIQNNLKGLSIKDVRSQWEVPSADIFRSRKGVLQMRTPHILVQKKLRIFQNLWCVSTDKGRV